MNNDIVTKARLNAALGTEGNMGFEHNDIVTVDVMEKAIEEGGGGGGGQTAEVTLIDGTENGSGYNVNVGTFIPDGKTTPIVAVSHESPVTVRFPIYNGAYYLYTNFFNGSFKTESPMVTGDIEYANDIGAFVIRGNGSITLQSMPKN